MTLDDALADPDDLAGSLYDRYLDELLEGGRATPEEFLERVGHGGQPQLQELLARVHAESSPGDGGSSTPSEAAPWRQLGDFRLVEKLGDGGMGVVYLAEQMSLHRSVALKVVRPEYAHSPTARVRFEREARAVARLRHPHLVPVHAVGEDQGVRYLVMEYVPGRGLDEILRDARAGEHIPTVQIIRWVAQVARALAAAHAEGVVHRDVKPSNIRVDSEVNARLLDFGLAREITQDLVTFTQSFVGSPHYAAPEQVSGKGGDIDARTDVYALGCVLYEAITGQVPFAGPTVERVLHQIVSVDPPRPRNIVPQLSRDLEVVVLKAMEKEPRRRYVDADAFAEDLEALLEFRPIQARAVGPLTRTLKWGRRHRALAATAITGLSAVVVLAGVLVGQSLHEQHAREKQAASAIEEVRQRLARYTESLRETRDHDRDYAVMNGERLNRWFTPAEDRRIDDLEDSITRLRKERDDSFHRVSALLRQARTLGAAPDTVDDLERQLFVCAFKDAEQREDAPAKNFYRDLLQAGDPDEKNAGDTSRIQLGFLASPAQAEVHAFFFREVAEFVAGGDHRWIPVPYLRFEEWPVTPGAWVLRVNADLGELRSGDVILEVAGHPVEGTVFVDTPVGELEHLDRLHAIDGVRVTGDYEIETYGVARDDGEPRTFVFRGTRGERTMRAESLKALGVQVVTSGQLARRGGVPGRVWQDGNVREMLLPAGLDTRLTAAPYFFGPASLVGTGAIPRGPFEIGEWMFIARMPGRAERRVSGDYKHAISSTIQVDLASPSVPGFVNITSGWFPHPRWIQEREITFAEYLEFLNDPDIRDGVDTPDGPGSPRQGQERFVVRDEHGRHVCVEDYRDDWPVHGVSWHDARAYAEWRGRRARAAGQVQYYFGLPTRRDWIEAGCVGPFVFGERFRPKWVSSCFARREPAPEPCMRFPIDESPLGVYDMSGSVAEWLQNWYREDLQLRWIMGGSWANGGPAELFEAWGGRGMAPERTSVMVGFRLLLEIREE